MQKHHNSLQRTLMSTTQKPFVKGYKYRIYPTADQIELLNKTFGCVRYVYNKALAEAKLEYENYIALKNANTLIAPTVPKNTGYAFINKLTNYKSDPEALWLKEVDSVALQQSMLHLGSSFSKFFKERKGYPKFKSKHSHQSFSLMTNSFRFKDKDLFISKSKEPLKVIYDRPLPSAPTSATISKTPTGKYYISFVCEYLPVKTSGIKETGIDLGLKDFLVTSDSLRIANPKHLKQQQYNLKRKQQSLSRKCKGSKNRNKARIKVALIHESITNCRKDFLHKLSTKLINENQVIGLEKLRVKNMVRNRKLSKAIIDVAWSTFTRMLEYKAIASQQCNIVYMDLWYPSTHICSSCDSKLDYKLKLSDREWICPHCGTVHDRDINAAINIRNEALKALVVQNVSARAKGCVILASNK